MIYGILIVVTFSLGVVAGSIVHHEVREEHEWELISDNPGDCIL